MTDRCHPTPIGQSTDKGRGGGVRAKRDNAPVLEHHTGASAISPQSQFSTEKRRKPGKCFFITVDLLEYYESVRKDFKEWFSELVTFCIAVETSRVSKRVSFHLHAYLEFENKLFLSDLREYLESCMLTVYEEVWRFDIQSCKSTKSVLKYITKEDRNPFYNCKMTMLHFNYRSYMWALSTPRFLHSDPFVQEHRFCYRFLEKLWNDVRFEQKFSERDKLLRVETCFANWTMDVATWWNNILTKYSVKNKQLYLYGPSNVGKSSYIERIIGRSMMKYVYFPGVGKFFMQGYRPGFHKVILFEEFDIKYHVPSMLKRLLEGRRFAYPVKGLCDVEFVHRGPIIFVSNYMFDDMDDALKNRFLFVSATTPFWEALEALVPKEEVDGYCSDDEVSIVELSEDELEEENKRLWQTLSAAGF